MKMKHFLVAAGMAVLSTHNSFAGEPANPATTAKPQKEIRYYCEVPGLRTEKALSENNTMIICALVSTAACMYIPCNPSVPIDGPLPSNVIKVGEVPLGLHIEEGQDFVAWRNTETGALQVRLLQGARYVYDDHANDRVTDPSSPAPATFSVIINP